MKQMNSRACLKSIYTVLAAIALCLSTTQSNASASKITVQATGSAKTRDGALVDACRLAVAQVHGSRLSGVLLKTNETNKHGISFGKTFEETRDLTLLTFQGLLLNYKLLEENQPDSENSHWRLSIDAEVLTAVPDRFSGRIAVVTPSLKSIKYKVGNDPSVATWGVEISRAINNWFANNPHFVILERANESDIDAELARASSGASAVSEKSKLKSQKAADVVIVFQGGKVSFSESSTKFKLAGEIHRAEASTSMTIKAIDVATKGEIGRTSLTLKSSRKSSRSSVQSRSEAIKDLKEKMTKQLPLCELQILAALDTTRLQVDADGSVKILSPLRELRLKNIEQLQLWKPSSDNSSVKVNMGTFKFDSQSMKIEINSHSETISSSQIFAFTPINTTP